MPSMDRHWRLILGIGIVVTALAVALPIWFLISLLSTDGSLSAVLTHTDWSSLGVYLILPVFSAAMLSEATKSGRREWLRERGRAGDDRAMLLAAIKPSTIEQTEATHELQEVLWRTDQSPWIAAGVLLSLGILITVATMFVAAILASADALALTWNPLTVCAALLALELGLLGWWWSRRPKGPTGVVATDAGLRWLQAGRDKAFIPWSEARLFEVWRWKTNNQTSGYALSGVRTLIEWVDYSPDQAPAAADGASYEEMLRRSRALAQTVIARTGLTPRTCEPSLAVKEEASAPLSAGPSERPSGWRRLSPLGSAFMVALAASPFIAAVCAPLAPLTTSQPLNIYVALTMGAAGLALLVVDVRAIVEIVREGPAADAPRPDVRLPPSPQSGVGPLSLRMPHIWRDRLIALVIGLLTAGDIYALVRGYVDFPEAVNRNVPWWDLHKVTTSALFLWVFLLTAVALAGITHRGTRIIADEWGVRSRRGRKETAIPWDMIAELVIQVEKGKVESYEAVAGDARGTKVDWPANALWSGSTFAPGESPGAVFAAAVAQRAGVTPRVEYK